MQNRKYQVFISSTYSDLVEERKKVLDVLLMADCIPAGMEALTGLARTAWMCCCTARRG